MIDEDAPITPAQAYDSEYWRRRARASQVRAEAEKNQKAKSFLAKVASDYEKLALRAEAVQAALKCMQ